MNKKYVKIALVTLIIAFALFTLISCGSDSNEGETTQNVGNVDNFVKSLEADGFTVQEGEFTLVDAIDLFNRGITPDCNANNAGNPYLACKFPEAPGQTLPNIVENLVYPLRADEALIFVGKTPPKMKYFSYRSFMVDRYYENINDYKKVYASLGDNINYLSMATSGTPYGAEGDPFNKDMMVISTSDRGIDTRVREAARSAGSLMEY